MRSKSYAVERIYALTVPDYQRQLKRGVRKIHFHKLRANFLRCKDGVARRAGTQILKNNALFY